MFLFVQQTDCVGQINPDGSHFQIQVSYHSDSHWPISQHLSVEESWPVVKDRHNGHNSTPLEDNTPTTLPPHTHTQWHMIRKIQMAVMASVGSSNCTTAQPLDLPSPSVWISTFTILPATLNTSFSFCQVTE